MVVLAKSGETTCRMWQIGPAHQPVASVGQCSRSEITRRSELESWQSHQILRFPWHTWTILTGDSGIGDLKMLVLQSTLAAGCGLAILLGLTGSPAAEVTGRTDVCTLEEAQQDSMQ